jgi:hypothetical protein
VDGNEGKGTKDRKPGSQPGNQKALKHGFYSRLWKGDEAQRIADLEDKYNLDGEIDLLRVFINRLAEKLEVHKEYYTVTDKAGNVSEIPDDYNLRALNTFSSMTQALATVIRTHYLTKGKGGTVETGIMQALEELRLEMGL